MLNKKLGKNGLDLIKASEGLELTAYVDGGGVLTIGYGHTGADVTKGKKITQAEADALLIKDTASAVAAVNSVITNTALTDNQFDACVCLAYNIGNGAFKASTLVKKINAKDMAGAAEEFLRWNKDNGKVVQGLTNRRVKERALFLKA